MSDQYRHGTHRPFKHLDRLLKKRDIPLADYAHGNHSKCDAPLSPQQEARLFAKAMSEVQPLQSNLHCRLPERRPIFHTGQSDDEQYAREALQQLVRTGQGYRVADTSEYMEAAAPGIGKEILRQLHQGRYAIQAHTDLHGLCLQEAQQALENFIQEAVHNGLRAVTVIHGRGLSSPKSPVIKKMVYALLTRGPLRKWVIALTSARPCDGGAGATYVLLRQRAATKRNRKQCRPKFNGRSI
jgi:DNA-nicking Smr family endonuclease